MAELKSHLLKQMDQYSWGNIGLGNNVTSLIKERLVCQILVVLATN